MTTDFKSMMKNQGPLHDQTKVQNFYRQDYNFHPNFNFEIPSKSVTTNGVRHYTTPDGNRYPSITTILGKSKSARDKAVLDNWKKRVGEDEATKITKAAAERGTALHTLVENFLTANGQSEYPIEGDKNGRLFKQIHPMLGRIGTIHIIEKALYSDILKIAGKVDLIGEFDGKLSVIDFKTSTKYKTEAWIQDYLIQETFYAVAFGALFPERVEQIVTIMAVEETGEPLLFVRKPGDYIPALVERVKKYYAEIDQA